MATAYATPGQFLARWPAVIVAQALTFDVAAPVAAASVKTHPGLAAALDDATGEIRAAALAGERYDEDDLEALAAAGEGLLVKTTCDLAWGTIRDRKGQGAEPIPEPVKEAREKVKMLRFGLLVFPIASAEDAGLPKVLTPSQQQLTANGLFADKPFFPPRGWPPRGW